MSDKTDKDRRHFLFSVSGAAVAAAGGSLVIQGCGTGMPMGDAGGDSSTGGGNTGLTVADVSVGSVVAARNAAAQAMIGRDAMGFYALDSVCTHQGCTVAPTNAMRLDCPCHASHYDGTGNVVMPAPGAVNQGPLPMLTITFTGTGPSATISVNRSAPVSDRAMRFMPPA